MTSLELAKKAAAFLDNKKAERVHVIEIENISSLADYFVIATGNNNTHVRALADELEALAALTKADLDQALADMLAAERSAMVVVWPAGEGEE